MMNLQISQVLDCQSPINSTQNKILKLMQQLKKSQQNTKNNESHTKKQQTVDDQIKKFKKQIQKRYNILDQKTNTAILMLDQVQKQITELTDNKRKLRMSLNHKENIQQIQNQTKLYYSELHRQKQRISKQYTEKILEIKMMDVEQQEKIKYQLDFNKQEVYMSDLNRIKRNCTHEKQDLEFREVQFGNKIQMLKRSIQEDGGKNKEQLRKIKDHFLGVCELSSQKIKKQEEGLQEDFGLLCKTLERLVYSISDNIVS